MLRSLGQKHCPWSEQTVPSKTDSPLSGHLQGPFPELPKEGTRLLYPAVGKDWHCDSVICRKLNWLRLSPRAGCAAGAVHLLHLDQEASQFSNRISELKRTACCHPVDKDKVPETEGCSLQSSNETSSFQEKPELFNSEMTKYVYCISSACWRNSYHMGLGHLWTKKGYFLTTQL